MSIVESSVPEGVAYGPTWAVDDDGSWRFPRWSLGWQILGWTKRWLRQPDGPEAGRPWKFTAEQARLILWWYAVDERGRWLDPYGVLRRVKGWGKDPVGAVICAVEFVGPCRFDHWNDQRDPVGVPHPSAWVQTAAVSKEQTRNTMTLFPALFSDEAISEFGIDLGKEIIYAGKGRRRIEAVTSSPRALEGGRATFVLKNETQHWITSNEGHAMAEVIDRNAVKSRDGSARALALTNAHAPGEDSDAERDWDAFCQVQAGKSKSAGFLYDSLEAPADTDMSDEGSLRAGIRAARGDSGWLDEDRTVEAIWDPRTSPSTSRRFYLNQLSAADDAWVAPQEWDRLADAAVTVADQEIVTLGFDGSKTDDHTALIGCRVSDGHVFTIGVWDPADYDGEAPRDLIDGEVHRTFARYDVVGFFSDLHPWESYVDSWAEEFGDQLCAVPSSKHPVAFDMRARNKEFTREGAERVFDEIVEGSFTHDGDWRLRRHVHNARRRPNSFGVSLGKEHRESSRKVDASAAMVLARMARRVYLALPDKKKRRQRSGRAMFV